jgi:hypothetical protein
MNILENLPWYYGTIALALSVAMVAVELYLIHIKTRKHGRE